MAKHIIEQRTDIPVNEIGEIKLTVVIAGKLFTLEPADKISVVMIDQARYKREMEIALLQYADKLGFRLIDEI